MIEQPIAFGIVAIVVVVSFVASSVAFVAGRRENQQGNWKKRKRPAQAVTPRPSQRTSCRPAPVPVSPSPR